MQIRGCNRATGALAGAIGVWMLVACSSAGTSNSDDNPPSDDASFRPSDPSPDASGDHPAPDAGLEQISADDGEIGLVVDVRDIFRKGYEATQVEVSFADHAALGAVLEVDPITTLAILRISRGELDESEIATLNEGVAAVLVVRDAEDTELARREEDRLVLDDSNRPLSLQTELPFIIRPLALKPQAPYLLQLEGGDGVISSFCSDCYPSGEFMPDTSNQQFYFVPVDNAAEPDTYYIEHHGYAEGTRMYVDADYDFVNLAGAGVTLPDGAFEQFVLEQDDDGWLRIRLAGTQQYLARTQPSDIELRRSESHVSRFRLISDNIAWNIIDRGTVYHQPIMPPTRVEFAYEATIRNCSSAMLTETVGRAETRTRRTTTETTESLQLFSSEQESLGLKVGLEVGNPVGVKASVEASLNYVFTTSETRSTQRGWSETEEDTTEVSRIREIEVPPHTSVRVRDIVRSVRNIQMPFTQQLRLTGTYRDTGATLSGSELVTQMSFNFVSGLVTQIGNEHLDVALRGQVVIDQLLDVSSEVNEISGACDR